MSWFVYIVECKDGKLYTGITNNLKRRIKVHNSGNGYRFTKYWWPVILQKSWDFETKSQALKEEARIKGLPKEKKLALIKKIKRSKGDCHLCFGIMGKLPEV